MTKRSFLNYINDVLEKNLSKTQNKEEILNNQKIVATSLSNRNFQTLKKNNEFQNREWFKRISLLTKNADKSCLVRKYRR